MIRGIEPREDFPSRPHFEELLKEQHLLISKHTRRYLREEQYFPGSVIERANRARWLEEGALTLGDRAKSEVERLVSEYEPSGLPDSVKDELTRLMQTEAKKFGVDKLPAVEL
jgi:trimethylamine:corrinoid methyltransferase-like protein